MATNAVCQCQSNNYDWLHVQSQELHHRSSRAYVYGIRYCGRCKNRNAFRIEKVCFRLQICTDALQVDLSLRSGKPFGGFLPLWESFRQRWKTSERQECADRSAGWKAVGRSQGIAAIRVCNDWTVCWPAPWRNSRSQVGLRFSGHPDTIPLRSKSVACWA